MMPRCWQAGLLTVMLALPGCKTLFSSEDKPEDPLFLTRKPIEAKANLAPPAHVAYLTPAIPPSPFANPSAIAQKKTPPNPAAHPASLPDTLPIRDVPQKKQDAAPR